MKIPEETKVRAMQMYQDGTSAPEIARTLGVSVYSVREWADRRGVSRGGRLYRLSNLPKNVRDEMRRLSFEEGVSDYELAQRFGVYEVVVVQYLDTATMWDPRGANRRQEIIDGYQQ